MNLPQKLASEIHRVIRLQFQYEGLFLEPGMRPLPLLAMMRMSLERAIEAAGKNDAMTQIEAVKDLEGYEG